MRSIVFAAAAFVGCVGVLGCQTLGLSKSDPPKEIKILEEPNPGPLLEAPVFPTDLALQRVLEAEPELDQPFGSRSREFNWTGTALTSAAVSPDGEWLAVGNTDGVVRINGMYRLLATWECPAEARVLDEITRRPAAIAAVAYRSVNGGPGTHMLWLTRNGRLQIWPLDGKTGQPRLGSPGGETGIPAPVVLADTPHATMDVHPSGQLVAAAGTDGIVRLVALPDGKVIAATPTGAHRNAVSSVRFSPDGQRLVSADEEGQVLAWATESLRAGRAALPKGVAASAPPSAPSAPPSSLSPIPAPPTGAPAAPPTSAPVGPSRPSSPDEPWVLATGPTRTGVASLAFAPRAVGGTLRLAAGLQDGRILLWRLPSDPAPTAAEPELLTSDQTPASRHTGSVRSLAFAPSGLLLVTGTSDGQTRLWVVEGEGAELTRLVDAKTGGRIQDKARFPRQMYVTAVNEFGATPDPTAAVGAVSLVGYSPDGLDVLVAGERGAILRRARKLNRQGLMVATTAAGAAPRAVDWTRPTPPADFEVLLRLVSDPRSISGKSARDGGTGAVVEFRVNNITPQEGADLHQLVAVTECFYPAGTLGDPNLLEPRPVPGLHGQRIHFGRVPSKVNNSKTAEVRLVPSETLPPGEYTLSVLWRHAAQPTPRRFAQTITVPIAGGRAAPQLALGFHLLEEAGAETDGVLQFGERARLALLVRNVGTAQVDNLTVRARFDDAAREPSLAAYALEIKNSKDGVLELPVGRLRPGEVRRKVIGPLAIKSVVEGADGTGLPDGTLPLALEFAAGGAPLREQATRLLRVPVARQLADIAATEATESYYRIRDAKARRAAVVQFRAGPGPETAVIAESDVAGLGPLVADAVRKGWVRLRLPNDAVARLAEVGFNEGFVWVPDTNVEPTDPRAEGLTLVGLRLTPFGDESPVLDHNFPPDGSVGAPQFTLSEAVAGSSRGIRRVTLLVDGKPLATLFEAEADKAAPLRAALPATAISLEGAPPAGRLVELVAEDGGSPPRRQVIRARLRP